MFQAPLSISTDTAHELPPHLYEIGDENPWVATHLWPRHAHSFLTGLTFDATGTAWVVDTPFGRIFRLSTTGDWELVVKYDGWPTALAFYTDSKLLVADARHGLLALDVPSRGLSPQVTHVVGERFKGLAAVCIAKNGDIYLADAGQSGVHDVSGAVYRVRPDGEVQCLIPRAPGPSGLALSNDERSVFVSMRNGAVWRAPLIDNGTARVSAVVQLSGGIAPAGLAMDHDDQLLVAHYGLGCVWMFNKRREPRYRLDSTRGDWITSVAIDPTHPQDVYFTDAQTGSILKAALPMY